jgi:hypothetical protein
MPGSSSTSSSEPSPGGRRAGLLGAVVLVLAGEAAVSWATVPDRGRHPSDAVLTAVDRGLPRRPVLFWGDSASARSLEGKDDGGLVNDIASSQAVSMGGVFFTVRRHVERSGAPDAVVLCAIPEAYTNDLDDEHAPSYFEDSFNAPREILDHWRVTGRGGQALRMALYAAVEPPSLRRQAWARRAGRELRGDPTGRRPLGPDPLPLPDRDALVAERIRERTFPVSPVSRAYLERLASYLDGLGVRLVLLEGPVQDAARRAWDRAGTLDAQRTFLAELAGRHPCVEERRWDAGAWRTEEFYDRAHLLPSSLRRYGDRLLAELRAVAAEAAERKAGR